jgi:hypothetical protein
MRFLVTGTDTSGNITLRRETAAEALKKAAELAEDGCLYIAITAPDGHRYPWWQGDNVRDHWGRVLLISRDAGHSGAMRPVFQSRPTPPTLLVRPTLPTIRLKPI